MNSNYQSNDKEKQNSRQHRKLRNESAKFREVWRFFKREYVTLKTEEIHLLYL